MTRQLMLASAALAAAVLTTAASAAAPLTQAPVTQAAVAQEGRTFTVTWKAAKAGAPVDVYVAARPDAPPAQRRLAANDDTDGQATFTDPAGAGVRPYFFVQGDGARQGLWTAARVVPLEGAANFRDIGGYPTKDGRHVKWGQVYRSNTLARLTAADFQKVNALGVRLVCDLRTDEERAIEPTLWVGTAPVFVNSPKASLGANLSELFGKGPLTAESMRATFIGFYGQMHEQYAGEYRELFKRLLAGETPMLMHCSAGKDRTGVGSALVLSALGVPRDIVVADYAMSETLLGTSLTINPDDPDAAMFARLPPEVIRVLMRTEPAYIEATFAAIEKQYGSVDAYLETALGVGPKERAALRARLTE